VLYLRISSDSTGRAAGVERQEADCRALAEQLGWTVVEVRTDNDISAYSGKPRPAFKATLEDLRSGHADAIIAWHPDRLYRRLPDLEELAKVAQERGIQIRTVKAGVVDLTTASGIMTAEILASVAKHEVAHAIERVVRAKADNVANGTYRGGPRPYGFEPDGVTIRESEAQWIRMATNAIINGETLSGICRTLAENDVRTPERRYKQADGSKGEPESGLWKPTQLREMLRRGRNAGLLEAGNKVVGKAVWPAIVDEETWQACVAILADPSRRTTTGNAKTWLLSGIAKCWCGSVVKCSTSGIGGAKTKKNPDDPDGEPIVVKRQGHVAAYRCKASNGHVSRRAERLDMFIEAILVRRLARPDAVEMFLPPSPPPERGEDLALQANVLRSRISDLAREFAEDDDMTAREFKEASRRLNERLAEVEARMATRAHSSILGSIPLGSEDISEAWKTYTVDHKRAIIAAAMDITIHPAKRGRPSKAAAAAGTQHDIDSIDVKWKRAGGE